ncbi:MAG: hypothetical protein EOM15_06425 [Spirochaetia bacterium]|nr:hypothetical protein [Spirochaetia bacterium]
MVFDVLDCLEWYRTVHPRMQQAIDILDRSSVYDQSKGTYTVDGLTYRIETYLTDAAGILLQAGEDEVQVVLEGEELFSLQLDARPELVFLLTTGMFVFVRKDEVYRCRQDIAEAKAVKKVVFSLGSCDF